MNVLTPTLGLGVGYSERYAQQSKCSNVRTTTLVGAEGGGVVVRTVPVSSACAAASRAV